MKQKKDILFLCQFFHPEYISSAQLPFDTAKALHQAGFSVGVLCGYPREYSQSGEVPLKEDIGGISVHRLKYFQTSRAGFLGRILNYFSFTFQVFLHLPQMGRYRGILVYSNPPIVPWIATWAKRLFGTKLIFVAYDLYPEVATVTNTLGQGSMICRLMNHINRQVFPAADAVVALSGEMRQFILAHRHIAPEKVHVIPNWYADEGVSGTNRENNPFRQVTRDRFTVSYFGNMGTVQDMQTILDAIAQLKEEKDLFFLFAGHGNKFEKVKTFLEKEKIENAAIYKFLHGDDFRNALAISDCALVSLDRGLTGTCVPSKTYSYMMRGLPMLAVMDEGDIVRDIESGAGLWVRNDQAQELAQCILRMRDDPESCQAMSSACRRIYLEKYTRPVCTGKYVELLSQLLEPERGVSEDGKCINYWRPLR